MQKLLVLAACAALFVAGCNGKTENKDTKKKTDDTTKVEKKMDEKKMDEKEEGSAKKQSSLQAESCTSDSVTI